MPISPEKLKRALKYIDKAHDIVNTYLFQPHQQKTARHYRGEMMRRLTASDDIAIAREWVERLDAKGRKKLRKAGSTIEVL